MASKSKTKQGKDDLQGHWNRAFENSKNISKNSYFEGDRKNDNNGDNFVVIDSKRDDFYDVKMAGIRDRRGTIDLRDDDDVKRIAGNSNSSSAPSKSKTTHMKDNRSDESKIKSNKELQLSQPTAESKSGIRRKQSPSQLTSEHKSAVHRQQSPTNPQQKNILRNAIYYQNRFIVLDSPADAKTNSDSSVNVSQSQDACDSGGNTSLRMTSRRQQQKSKDGNEETSFSNKMAERVAGNRKNMEMDASSVTMDARGIEIILTDPENSSRPIATEESKRKNTLLKKINRILLDNRVKGRESEIVLRPDNPEEYKVLKKVLNFVFLTIGAMLFLSVIICVIYAFAVGEPEDTSGLVRTTTVSP